jgi:hypothetical protein
MIAQYSKSEWAGVGDSGVIVGLPGRNQSHLEIGDHNPCSGQSSEKVRLAQILSNFCEIVVSEFFNSHRDYHHQSQNATIQGLLISI